MEAAFVVATGRPWPAADVRHTGGLPAPASLSTQRTDPACSTERRAAAAAALAAFAAVAPQRRKRLARRAAPAVEAPATAEASGVPTAKIDFLKKFFKEVLEVRRPPSQLEVFLKVLQGSDWEVLGEGDWEQIGGDLHPFMLPLATRGDGDDIQVIGLLIRKPNGAAIRPEDFLVVSQRPRKSLRVALVAADMNKYIARRAEEANFNKEQEDEEVIEATKDVYEIRFTGKDQTALDKWLLLEVGPFPDVYMNLCNEKIAEGDFRSGLVIADTMRDIFGEAWAFPHSFQSGVLTNHFKGGEAGTDYDRGMEAEHGAQRCISSGYPLWTLEDGGEPLEDVLAKANMPKLQDVPSMKIFYLKRVVDDQRAAVRTGSISEGCATLAKGQALMDAVCCGHKSYATVRQELADLYEEVPGCEPLVNMIMYFKPK